jgi:hypothetical protein
MSDSSTSEPSDAADELARAERDTTSDEMDGSDTSSEKPAKITEPFDPTAIRVKSQPMTVALLLERIAHKELILNPDFQRNEVWKLGARSRLIESTLIRIPLPAVYVDATDDDRWLVIDGLQRLSTFQHFVAEQSFALEGLEFLTDFEGRRFNQLDRPFQRRINETSIDVNQLDAGTPAAVKFNIFKRINTGGLPLSPQEIRHALNQGPATLILAELAKNPRFLTATSYGIAATRMADREAILRALAFLIMPYRGYKGDDFDGFLRAAMISLNQMSEDHRQQLSETFLLAMDRAYAIFGRSAFRKAPWTPVNKALFETWSVNLALLSDQDALKLSPNQAGSLYNIMRCFIGEMSVGALLSNE